MFIRFSTRWTSAPWQRFVQFSRYHPSHRRLAFLIPGIIVFGGLHSAAAAPSFYWRGGNGNWTDLAKWAESADGATAYNAATYGDVSFNTTDSKASAQIITLDVDRTINGLDFATSGTTSIIGNVNRTLQFYKQITVNSGAGAVTLGSAKDGQKVAIKLNSEPNTWTNNSAQSLTFQNDVQVGDWSVLTVTGSGNTIVNGVISQAAGNDTLSKSGAGILTISGANTYLGTTSVSGGTLIVNGIQNKATGALTVSGSGTVLAGGGTIGGNTTIGKGSIHSAGAVGAVGKQVFDQAGSATTNLSYSSGSIFSWNIDRTQSQTRGTGYDAVDVTGTLDTTSGAIFQIVIGDTNFSDAFWNTPRTWSDIFTNGSKAITNWANIFSGTMQYLNTSGTIVSPTGEGSFSLSGNTLAWTPQFAAVPEPTSALAGLLIAAGLLRRRRP